MLLTIKLNRNWNSFQLAISAPPLNVTDSAIAPSARMVHGSHGVAIEPKVDCSLRQHRDVRLSKLWVWRCSDRGGATHIVGDSDRGGDVCLSRYVREKEDPCARPLSEM
jgi:hypothetical protein